jgi:ABC-2 type transport system permease protein
VGAAVLRGVLVGGITWVVAALFTGFEVAHPALALAMLILVAVVFAGLGVVSAIWAQSFEQVNFFPTFFILPLTFLGGVFYSARALPPALEPFTRANPVFYMVDAVRFGMLGISDAPPLVGAALVGLLALGALICPYLLLRSGWRLRG